MSQYEAARVLREVCARVGDEAFGYLLQGLFAHVLLHLGFAVQEVNATGHPDIVAVRGGKTVSIEVELLPQTATSYVFRAEDVQTGNAGYVVLVQCREPVGCMCIPCARAARWLGTPVRVATLRALADKVMTEACSEEFCRIVVTNATALRTTLSYAVLRQRALRGEALPPDVL